MSGSDAKQWLHDAAKTVSRNGYCRRRSRPTAAWARSTSEHANVIALAV
jgi:hypothetical protein